MPDSSHLVLAIVFAMLISLGRKRSYLHGEVAAPTLASLRTEMLSSFIHMHRIPFLFSVIHSVSFFPSPRFA